MSDEIKITAGDRFLWPEFPPDHLQYPPEHRGVWVADEPMKLDSTKTNMLHWAMHRESDGAVRNWFPLNPPFLRLPPLPAPEIKPGDRFLWPEFPTEQHYPPEYQGVWVADKPTKLAQVRGQCQWRMHRESDGMIQCWFPLSPPFTSVTRPSPLPAPEIKPGDRFLWAKDAHASVYGGVWVADQPDPLLTSDNVTHWLMHRESDGIKNTWSPLNHPFTRLPSLPPGPIKPGDRFEATDSLGRITKGSIWEVIKQSSSYGRWDCKNIGNGEIEKDCGVGLFNIFWRRLPPQAPQPVKPGDLFEAAGSLGRVTKGSIWRAVGRSSLQDGTTGLGWDCINVVNGAIEKHCGLGLSSVWWQRYTQRYTNPLAPIESWEGLPLQQPGTHPSDPCPVGSRWKFKTLANQAVVTVIEACNESKRRVQFPDGAHSLWTTKALMAEATKVMEEAPVVLTEAQYLQKEKGIADAMLASDNWSRKTRKRLRTLARRNFLGDEGYRPSISGAGGNACGLYRIK